MCLRLLNEFSPIVVGIARCLLAAWVRNIYRLKIPLKVLAQKKRNLISLLLRRQVQFDSCSYEYDAPPELSHPSTSGLDEQRK